MKSNEFHAMVAEQKILNKIYVIRTEKVMLDFDLAVMYGVETKHLKRQVKRNLERFPRDFMFELSKKEFEILRSQIGTSSWGGTRYSPMAFTEQGIAMLSSIDLNNMIESNILLPLPCHDEGGHGVSSQSKRPNSFRNRVNSWAE